METPRDRLWIAALLICTGLVTAFRIWMLGAIDLAPDEAYYWQWSLAPALTYPDHPPLIAWLIQIGTALLGATETGVRLTSPLIAALATAVCYHLGRVVGLDITGACVAAFLSTILPATAAGAIITTPDTPLALFWILASYPLVRLAERARPSDWYFLGVISGIALYAKLSALLIPVSALLVILLVPAKRRQLASPHPWLAFGLALVIAAPYVIAEAASGCGSVSFQLAHLSGSLTAVEALSIPERLLSLVAGQIGLLTPLVAAWVVVAIRVAKKRPAITALSVAFLVPIGATVLSALFTHPELNWASLGHPAAAVLAVSAISRRKPAWFAALISTTLIITSVIYLHSLRPFLPLSPARDPVSRLHGWEGLGELEKTLASHDAVVADRYGLAAEVDWQLRNSQRRVTVSAIDRPSGTPPPGRWLLLLDSRDRKHLKLTASCESVIETGDLELKRLDGQVVRTIHVASGRDCREMNAPIHN